MTPPVASLIRRSSVIGLLALAGASVIAENFDELPAPAPIAASEPVVQVWGARTRGPKGIFGVHSWVAVKPAGATDYTVYEVVGWRLRWTDTAVVVRNRAPNQWFGAEGELYAEKRGPGVEELIERIDKAARDYPYAQTYTVWPGPNSNTFTAWIARAVPELEVDLPATAIGKDYLGSSMVSSAPSGKGFQFSLRGLFGVAASSVDGFELNLLSLNFGVSSSGIKLPIVGRIGTPRIPGGIVPEAQATPGAANP
jgi:Protein of unknown function (DUF3750)